MKAASFFSSSLWKRRFSSSNTSPGFSARTASSASGPMQSSAKATGLPSTLDSGSTSGFNDISGTRLPSGRPKWLSTVTLPFFIGTLRSTRTSTRLPATSTESIVLKLTLGMHLLLGSTFANDEYQHIAFATTRNQFMACLLAVRGKVLLRGRVGGAHRKLAADRKLAQLAVGAQYRQRAEQPRRVVFEGLSHGVDNTSWLRAATDEYRRVAWCPQDACSTIPPADARCWRRACAPTLRSPRAGHSRPAPSTRGQI